MINHIYKPKGERIWRWRFRYSPTDGKIQDVSLGTSDKQCAERKRAELLEQAEREHAGILPSKPLRQAAVRPLGEHAEEFRADLTAQGKNAKYVALLEVRLGRLIHECNWTTLQAISPDSFQQWRQRQSFSPKTLNDYLEAAKGLCNWMVRQGRLSANPLSTVQKVKTRPGATRQRRAFTSEELQRLCEVVTPERRALYIMAVHTGLRRGELAQLCWSDVHLDETTPYVQVRASTTKNGRSATLRLHADVVAVLGELREQTAQAHEPVFAKMPRMKRFRADLKLAGIAYRDSQGRVADFHALRHTLCTNLHKAGVPQRTAMELMRHSDARLTNFTYTDSSLLGTAEALQGLPTLLPSQIASQISGAAGQTVAEADTAAKETKPDKPPANIDRSRTMARRDAERRKRENGARCRVRTCDPFRVKEVLYH